jgi:hypothetical protein
MTTPRAASSSWPLILGLATAFVVAFMLLRANSNFLAIEREAPALHALARQHDLAPAMVFALREQAVALPPADFAALVARFPQLVRELGEPLAAVAMFGSPEAARAARAQATDAEAAWQQARLLPTSVPGVRFLLMRDRFAGRAAARNGN